ncbi:O-acyltransferase WSD1 [Vitis vinifera]|uniref:O-acyltransferase WSD1 n=1 Tax=Vitis vinifera TaxID=29760 RepID=A0A438IFI3_VITVI|nr:O-acyltransferase WSD1 [Vitis vinifera]
MEPVDDLESRQQALEPIQTKRSAAREVEGNGEKPEDIEELLLEEEEALSPVARIFHEPCLNVYVLAISGFKTRIDVDVVKANLGHTLLKHPRFSSLQHVIVPRLHHTIDSPDKTVEDYISNLSKTSIDFSKPLWELHILNIKTSDAESIVVLRIHHSLGDGMSLMSLVLACTRQISNPEALPTLPLKKTSNPDPDTKTPLNSGRKKGGVVGPRRFVYRTVSLDIKLIKNGMKTTINDVVMGVSLAGLSRYLNRRYGEAKEDKGATEKKNNLPKNIRLRATLIMNVRPSSGIHGLAEMMEKGSKAKWGTKIGFVLLPFNIALQDDPLDYVRQIKAAIDRKKHSHEAMLTFFIIKMVLKLFGTKVLIGFRFLMFVATTPFLEDTKTSLSSGQKKEDGLVPRRFVYRTINIDDIKLIKNGMKTVRPRKIKGATEKRNNLPKNIHLRATLLIDSQTEYTQASALPNQTDQELSSQLVTTTQGSCTIRSSLKISSVSLMANSTQYFDLQTRVAPVSSSSNDILPQTQIVGFQTSHAAWTALEKIFSTSSKARVMQLRLEFQTIRKGSLSMMEYILGIKNISNNLATIGESVSERDQIL